MHCILIVVYTLTVLNNKDNKDLLFSLNIIRFCNFKLSVRPNNWSNLNEIYTVD